MKTKVLITMVIVALVSVSFAFLITSDDSSATVGDTFTDGDLRYEVTQEEGTKTVKVLGFSGDAVEDLVIPNTVTHGSVYYVTEIATSAFDGKVGIKTANLGNVTSIGIESFAGCVQLTSVTATSATEIKSLAFTGCVMLEEFTGTNVSTIGISAFEGCVKLVEFKGNSLTFISPSAFTGCLKLETINLSNVTDVEGGAFAECRSLTSVDLSKVVRIGARAFYETGLTSVSLPITTISIGNRAFGKCTDLESISISSLSPTFKIQNGALVNRLENLLKTVPGGLNTDSFVIPDGIDEIDAGAFDGCANVTSVTIPSSVETIGDGAFRNCPKLASVTVDANNTFFKSVSGCLYSYDGTSIYFVPETYSGSFVVPVGVTTIQPYCFSDCIKITSIDARNVTDIGQYAFSDCYAMETMYINKDATIGLLSFDLGSIGHSVTCEVRSTGVDFIGLAALNLYTTINYALPVNFTVNGTVPQGVVAPDTVYVVKNESLSLTPYKTALARYGFTTSVDGTPYEGSAISVTTEPRTVTFTFDGTVYYTITFDTDGGSAIDPLRLNVGTAVPAVASPTKDGYEFKSWNPALPATMPAQDLTVKAVWAKLYTLTFDTDGGSAIAPKVIAEGFAIPAVDNPTKDGCKFKSWDPAIPATMPSQNLTVTAQWIKVVPKGDIVVDGDTKKVTVNDSSAEMTKDVIDEMKSGSANVQLSVNQVDIKMDTASFGTVAGSGDVLVSVHKSTGVKNDSLLKKLSEDKKKVAQKAAILDISFVTTGSTGNLGTVTLTAAYTPETGKSMDSVKVYYVSDAGDLEELSYQYADGKISISTTHFSVFAVCSESLIDEGSGGMNIGLIIGIAVGAIAVVGVVAFIIIKKH